MSSEQFTRLGTKDFQNGAVRNEIYNSLKHMEQLQTQINELEIKRKDGLSVEFGDGKILVFTTTDKTLIFSKRYGTGKVGEIGPLNKGDLIFPSEDDIVMKFKNIESLKVVKDAIEDIEQVFKDTNSG